MRQPAWSKRTRQKKKKEKKRKEKTNTSRLCPKRKHPVVSKVKEYVSP
jgi:hypothetical protein